MTTRRLSRRIMLLEDARGVLPRGRRATVRVACFRTLQLRDTLHGPGHRGDQRVVEGRFGSM